jgi:predicted nucleotidyltransferase
VIDLIEDNREAIATLCREFGVRKLAVFGSAANGSFDSDSSDIDFVVDLGGYERGVARRYLGLIVALEAHFGRPVDVVTLHSGTSNWFRNEVQRTAITIYERSHQAVVA